VLPGAKMATWEKTFWLQVVMAMNLEAKHGRIMGLGFPMLVDVQVGWQTNRLLYILYLCPSPTFSLGLGFSSSLSLRGRGS